jgi:hypothetical protein
LKHPFNSLLSPCKILKQNHFKLTYEDKQDNKNNTLFYEILSQSLKENYIASKIKDKNDDEEEKKLIEEFIEQNKDKKDNWQYYEHKEKIDIILNLFLLCPDKRLSDVVTSFNFYFQKF